MEAVFAVETAFDEFVFEVFAVATAAALSVADCAAEDAALFAIEIAVSKPPCPFDWRELLRAVVAVVLAVFAVEIAEALSVAACEASEAACALLAAAAVAEA